VQNPREYVQLLDADTLLSVLHLTDRRDIQVRSSAKLAQREAAKLADFFQTLSVLRIDWSLSIWHLFSSSETQSAAHCRATVMRVMGLMTLNLSGRIATLRAVFATQAARFLGAYEARNFSGPLKRS
jgi:hypothetical protein